MKGALKFLLAVAIVLVLMGGVGAFLVHTGRVPIAATTPADLMDRVAMTAKFEAVRRNGAARPVTLATDPATIARGREHFVENCLPCHGAPGAKRAEFAQGMNPTPPEIDGPLQTYTDGQLFWVIKNGIRATGMPAFAGNHTDAEITDIAAFVRHTPHLTPDERKELEAMAPGREHHH